ncbi:MAG: hypothetical protein COA85_08395 [Robiginitomaculum sp.]|nr:MAG: hypothetical protein COA85_08395 [Robiginitomaculum sp.]
MSRNLCRHFLQQAELVWRAIEDADKFKLAFGEETITETLLLELRRRYKKNIRVDSFDKFEESNNGADWEWWFGHGTSWIGMRVQAKRIKLPEEKFASLFYQGKNATQLQIENLIAEAKSARLIPVYCFYTHSKKLPAIGSRYFHCYRGWNGPFHAYGCMIAHAETILYKGSMNLSDIVPISFPWHCLVCECQYDKLSAFPPFDTAQNIYDLLKRTSSLADEREDRDPDFQPEIFEPRSELPEHMQMLYRDIAQSDDMLRRHAEEWDLGGLMLIDTGGRH